nr:putative ribonuclease H-like domain-containing protein [Tanacetum cinerariifolium]
MEESLVDCNQKKKHFKLFWMHLHSLLAILHLSLLLMSLKVFRDIFQIFPRIEDQEFDALLSKEDTVSFLIELSHTGVINSLNDVVIDQMHQPWRTFAALINRSLSGKTTTFDKLRLSRAHILWGMYYQQNVDYMELLWEDFIYHIDNRGYKNQEKMYYPRLTKKYRVVLPECLTSHQMKESKAYKTYHGYATVNLSLGGNDDDDSNDEEGNDDNDEVKDDDEDDDKFEGDEDRGMYSDDVQDKKADVRMTDAQQKKENLEITQEQVIEDTNVTITKKIEIPDFLDFPPIDDEIVSLLEVHVHHEVTRIHTSTLLPVPVLVIPEASPLPQILPEEVTNFALPVIEKMIQESLNQVNLTKRSSQPQSTYEAETTLTEFDLKKILIDKMNSSESYLTALEHQECYDVLVKSYNLDKVFFSSYDVYSLKRSRDDKDKDEGPSARSDLGLKKRKTSKDVAPATSPKTKDSSSRSSKGTKFEPKSFKKSVHVEEPEFKVGDTDTPHGQERNQGYDNVKPRIESASRRDWFTKSLRPQKPIDPDWNEDKTHHKGPTQNWLMTLATSTFTGPAFRLLKGTRSNYAELEYDFKECYKALLEKLDWENPEGDDYPFDLSKPLPLITHGNHQSVLVEFFINNDLKYLQGGISTMTYTTSTTKTKATKIVTYRFTPTVLSALRRFGNENRTSTTTKQSSHRAAASISTARHVNTVKVNNVTTAGPKAVVSVAEGNRNNAVNVSQMCDKKNSVLFTYTECVVLSPDFKLLDESQVLLKVPRNNNMYSFDLMNVVPIGGIENQMDHKVKTIRCDNGTEFKNRIMNEFCEMKGIGREFTVAMTPQQNGNQTNVNADTKANINTRQARKKTVPGLQYVLLQLLTTDSQGPKSSDDKVANDAGKKSTKVPRKENGVQDPAKEGDKNDQKKDVRDQEEALRK